MLLEKDMQEIVNILSLLRADSISYQNNPCGLMDKYDLMFMGEKHNIIYTHELLIVLKDYFHMNISNDSLHKIIPDACKALNMDCEPMKALKDLNNPTPYAYQIVLW